MSKILCAITSLCALTAVASAQQVVFQQRGAGQVRDVTACGPSGLACTAAKPAGFEVYSCAAAAPPIRQQNVGVGFDGQKLSCVGETCAVAMIGAAPYEPGVSGGAAVLDIIWGGAVMYDGQVPGDFRAIAVGPNEANIYGALLIAGSPAQLAFSVFGRGGGFIFQQMLGPSSTVTADLVICGGTSGTAVGSRVYLTNGATTNPVGPARLRVFDGASPFAELANVILSFDPLAVTCATGTDFWISDATKSTLYSGATLAPIMVGGGPRTLPVVATRGSLSQRGDQLIGVNVASSGRVTAAVVSSSVALLPWSKSSNSGADWAMPCIAAVGNQSGASTDQGLFRVEECASTPIATTPPAVATPTATRTHTRTATTGAASTATATFTRTPTVGDCWECISGCETVCNP